MYALDSRRRSGPPGNRPAQRGLSIIELMVGILVSMLVGLAATSTAVTFTASQRQGIGVGGVAVNANTALAALKNDAATAGLGFFGGTMFAARVSAFAPLEAIGLADDDFEEEAGRLDDTLAHAVERAITLSVVAAGLTFMSSGAFADPQPSARDRTGAWAPGRR